MAKKSKYYKCCFCGARITDDFLGTDVKYHSHSAKPLADGRCCQKCNSDRVMPYRLALLKVKWES